MTLGCVWRRRTLWGQRKTRLDHMGCVGGTRWSGRVDWTGIREWQIVHDGRRRLTHGVGVTRRAGRWWEFA